MAKSNEVKKAKKESLNLKDEQLKKLKSLFPEVFADGKVNWDKLKATLGESIDTSFEKFTFSWAGKSEAIKNVLIPSKATLRPNKKESIKFDETENIFIEGDNLEVLKLLQNSYFEKIKMIYIDPPYNTGNDFVYKDDFKNSIKNYHEQTGQVDSEGNKLQTNTDSNGRFHSDWLNMMYPRLKLAWNLLLPNGAIFISIDDNESHHLRLLMDEIFGEENFVALIAVENNPKGRKNSDYISQCNDYCLIYSKDKNQGGFIENIPKNINDMAEDENGDYVHKSGKRVLVGENSFNKDVVDLKSDKHYSVYYNGANEEIHLKKEMNIKEFDKTLLDRGFIRYISCRNGKFIENTYTENKFLTLFHKKSLEFKSDKIFEKNFSSLIRMKSLLTNKEYDALIDKKQQKFKIDVKTTSAGVCLKELFDTDVEYFPAPKNIGLIKLLMGLFDEDEFTILDFFSGSSTTAHAVLDMNKQDKIKRKFILIQLPEPCDKESEVFKAGYKTIADIGKERIRRVLKNIENNKNSENNKQILGFKVFKLDESNYPENQFEFDPDKDETENKKAFKAYLEKATQQDFLNKANELDLIYENIIKEGLSLNSKMEESKIGKNKVFKASDDKSTLLICLDHQIDKSTVTELKRPEHKGKIFIAFDNALDDSSKANLGLHLSLKTI